MTKKRRKNHTLLVSVYDFDSFLKKIEDCKTTLRDSPFYDKLQAQINHCTPATTNECIASILCYGLGNFTDSVIARYQLALLLLLKEYFDVTVHIYDPAFSEIEINFLIQLNIMIIEENEIGARKIGCRTFIFMPHCPTSLINNFLWCNWSPRNLSKCIIMANSFKKLAEAQTKRNFQAMFYYLHSILPGTVELEVENTFRYTDVFNDLGLHTFCNKALEKFQPDFWIKSARPLYDETEIEFVSRKLSKNLCLN